MPIQSDAFDQRIGRTNAPLTEHESRHIRARLHARVNQASRIDNHLRSAQVTNRSELLQDQSSIITLINRYQIALAPHKRLPLELLQHIFQYVFLGSDRSAPTIAEPPLLLCRICSSWRRTAISMPELWRSLHFFVEKDYTPLQKLQMAKTWFSRAGNLPLSLTLTDTSEGPPNVDFVQEVIVPFSRNFRNLHLVLRPPQIKHLLSLPVGSLDALEELHLVMHISFGPVSILPAWKPPISVFGPLSQLRRFRIQLTPFVVPQIFRLPWHLLETFRCDSSLQSEDCHELFLSCQYLRQIHVHVFGVKYSGIPRVEIPLPNLTHLSVHLCDDEAYDLFFLPLVLPALRSLLVYQYDGVPWSPGMYNGLIERSGCEIEDLYLGTLDADPQDVLRIFETTPSLRSVTFSHNTFISSTVLHKLGRNEIGGCLEQLFLKGTRELGPLLTMLEMRQELFGLIADSDGTCQMSRSPLKFLETYIKLDELGTHTDRIQTLRDQGIEISLLQAEETYFHL